MGVFVDFLQKISGMVSGTITAGIMHIMEWKNGRTIMHICM